ncbi:NAD-dependent epimerase/dehydratase family protein [Streptomyces sp. NPDC096176]|uniref:NAD-dependent epimerase/dehydratase family protein n=1 Tax=Streptomyces sp. NPDC096176 TaxID=3366079 RepID=UPI0038020765
MPVVVTGAAGFIGSHLTEFLLGAGYRVTGIDRRPIAAREGLTGITADLLDNDSGLIRALRHADAVFHLAGRPGVRDRSPEAEKWRRQDNVLATAAVLERVPLSVPLVVTSSSSVYGGTRDGGASHEDDPLRPRGGYAASKAEVEQLCTRRLCAGGRVAVCRPFTVAGENQRADMALAQWISAVAEDRPVRILGSAGRTRDVSDVRDVARAMTVLAERGFCGTVNIGTGTGHTLASLVAAVGRALSREPRVQSAPAPHDDPPHTRADTSRLAAITGWVPKTDLEALVERQVASCKRAFKGYSQASAFPP